MGIFHRQSVGDTVRIKRKDKPKDKSIEVTLEYAHPDPQNVSVNVKHGDITESVDLYQGDLVNIAKLVNIPDGIKLELRGVPSALRAYFYYEAPSYYKFIWH